MQRKIAGLLFVFFAIGLIGLGGQDLQVSAQQKKSVARNKSSNKCASDSYFDRKLRKCRKRQTKSPVVVEKLPSEIRDLPYSSTPNPAQASSDGKGMGTGRGAGIGSGSGIGAGTGSGQGTGSGIGTGTGSGIGSGSSTPSIKCENGGETTKLTILSKPIAVYTTEARQNDIQGTVRLRVTFSASGKITAVSPISGLPYGLTEQATEAARKMTFRPEKRCGKEISITKVIEYNFNLY